MPKTNSREKGKRGEREAAAYLRSIGFPDARRTQQYNGDGKSDNVCPDSLPHVHIETKYGYGKNFDLGTKLWHDACMQAINDADGMPWCVLWRPKGVRKWRLTYQPSIQIVTVVGDGAIASALDWLNEKGEAG